MADTLDLDAIEARERAATKGPWQLWRGHLPGADPAKPQVIVTPPGGKVGESFKAVACTGPDTDTAAIPDANFIAHARTDIPAMASLIRAQRERIERLEKFVHSCAYESDLYGAGYKLSMDAQEVLKP